MRIPRPDLQALVEGEIVALFVPRGAVDEGEEIALEMGDPRPTHELKAAYRAWSDRSVPGSWSAVVEAIHPTALIDPSAGSARHIFGSPPDGDLAILRVYGNDGPVLSDAAFAARVASLEGALRP